MDALQTQSMYLFLIVLFTATCVASEHNVQPTQDDLDDQKIEIFDSVYLSFPRENGTGRMLSLEVDTNKDMSEGRKKSKKLMQRILPIFIMPFVIQSAIIPFVLGLLKFMLIKSFLVGKLALTLIMFNAFRNHNSFKGRDAEMASAHYGYRGDGFEQYSSYFNR
ncbi:osiris 22 [Anticarsia gemmatalis]|uniref:osiris 22 n=1 Tax=Anticarsia gemmatalis TaxID=129554 RepID=UPI003F764247